MDNLNLNDLRNEITQRLLERWGPVSNNPIPPHNAGSGIVVGWDPNDCLPDLSDESLTTAPGVDLFDRYKDWLTQITIKWCRTGLQNATPEELNANLKGVGTIQWWRFCNQINLQSFGPIGQQLYQHAWECFQEECFNHLMGWQED